MGNGEEENVDIFALFLFACWIYEITLERNERTKKKNCNNCWTTMDSTFHVKLIFLFCFLFPADW